MMRRRSRLGEACGPGWGENDYDDYEGEPVRCEDDYYDCEPEWWQEEAERQRECLEQEYAETQDPARRRMLKIMFHGMVKSPDDGSMYVFAPRVKSHRLAMGARY